MSAEKQYRLIKKTIIFYPVDGKLYRKTEILEEVVSIPVIDLTTTPTPTIDLTSSTTTTPEHSTTLIEYDGHSRDKY